MEEDSKGAPDGGGHGTTTDAAVPSVRSSPRKPALVNYASLHSGAAQSPKIPSRAVAQKTPATPTPANGAAVPSGTRSTRPYKRPFSDERKQAEAVAATEGGDGDASEEEPETPSVNSTRALADPVVHNVDEYLLGGTGSR